MTADIIIIGGGVIGCSIAFNLARHGARNVVLLERGDICSGGTAKSCAIVRTHYSIRANLIHAVESLKIFENFAEAVGGQAGFQRTGYLILGPEEHRGPMEAVFRMQNALGIDTETLTPRQARQLHPLLALDDVAVIGYDTRTGYCDPYLTTTAYAGRARELGVTIRDGTPVTGLALNGATKIVQTPAGNFESPVVVFAAGPWTRDLGRMIGLEFPYVISRHKVITLKIDWPYPLDWPIVKDLTTPDKIYFRPETGGLVLVGTGDHGDPVEDPDALADQVDLAHIARIGALMSRRMPAFADAACTAGWTGPYDITPDWNPILGPLPGFEGFYVAVGFSGHGFKLAPTLGESLAQVVLGLEPRLPIDAYRLGRFSQGETLHGAYGIGSIS
ncbi:MAG: NAD(P)/FAD-dependent oxidoreductase [Anaerolineae bacterium]